MAAVAGEFHGSFWGLVAQCDPGRPITLFARVTREERRQGCRRELTLYNKKERATSRLGGELGMYSMCCNVCLHDFCELGGV